MVDSDDTSLFQDPVDEPVAGESAIDDEAASDKPVGRLAFAIAGCGILYHYESPTEYIEDAAIFPIPTTHHLFRGLINRRGSLVPIFDIRTLVDPDREPDFDRTRILVLGSSDDAAGILLDATPYRIYLTPDHETAVPSFLATAFGRYVTESFYHNDKYYVAVHLDDFLYDLRSESSPP